MQRSGKGTDLQTSTVLGTLSPASGQSLCQAVLQFFDPFICSWHLGSTSVLALVLSAVMNIAVLYPLQLVSLCLGTDANKWPWWVIWEFCC